jgi:hypothetical protein
MGGDRHGWERFVCLGFFSVKFLFICHDVPFISADVILVSGSGFDIHAEQGKALTHSQEALVLVSEEHNFPYQMHEGFGTNSL